MRKNIYKINILGWDKYNKNLKKGHKAILVSTGFLSDAKIRILTPTTKLLYLSCLLVAGESTSSQIEVSHESLVYQSGVKSGSLQSQLDLLQSLQLLTYEKNNILLNRIEKNRIEVEVKEDEKKEPPLSENKINSTLSFDNQFKFTEWNSFLRKNKLYCHDLGKNINLLVDRFEDLDSMREFLNEAHSRPTVKSLDERQKNNYMRSVLRGEIGLS